MYCLFSLILTNFKNPAAIWAACGKTDVALI
jgi:hypothetical protein